jgi:glucans biosynthesis protein
MPAIPPFAQTVATRTGLGGVIGQKRDYFSWRFVIDFAGGSLGMMGRTTKVEPVISASRGKIEITSARPLESISGYRVMFDLKPGDDSIEPIEIRLHLQTGGQPLTETWLYQWTPPKNANARALLQSTQAQ